MVDETAGRYGKRSRDSVTLTAAQKRKRALELRLAGLNYRQIAKQVGWANPGAAHSAVKRELQNIPKDAADELRTVELERYDEMQARMTERLRQGDLSVIRDMIRLSDQRAKLTGLYQADTTGDHLDIRVTLGALLADAEDIADEQDAASAHGDDAVDSAA